MAFVWDCDDPKLIPVQQAPQWQREHLLEIERRSLNAYFHFDALGLYGLAEKYEDQFQRITCDYCFLWGIAVDDNLNEWFGENA